MESRIFGFWGVRQFFIFTVSKRTRMFVPQMKSEVLFVQVTKLDSRNYIFAQKVTKMGSIIGHRIDYNEVGPLRSQRHIHSKN